LYTRRIRYRRADDFFFPVDPGLVATVLEVFGFAALAAFGPDAVFAAGAVLLALLFLAAGALEVLAAVLFEAGFGGADLTVFSAPCAHASHAIAVASAIV
jgi:hypothetical protein